MTARDWLMRQNPRRPATGGVQASEAFARLVDAERASSSGRPAVMPPDAGPVATAAAAVAESTERYYAAVLTPSAVAAETAPMLTHVQTKRLDSAFDRDNHCPVCAYRYSRCYPFAHGDDRD